jgi:hypothetical protein
MVSYEQNLDLIKRLDDLEGSFIVLSTFTGVVIIVVAVPLLVGGLGVATTVLGYGLMGGGVNLAITYPITLLRRYLKKIEEEEEMKVKRLRIATIEAEQARAVAIKMTRLANQREAAAKALTDKAETMGTVVEGMPLRDIADQTDMEWRGAEKVMAREKARNAASTGYDYNGWEHDKALAWAEDAPKREEYANNRRAVYDGWDEKNEIWKAEAEGRKAAALAKEYEKAARVKEARVVAAKEDIV